MDEFPQWNGISFFLYNLLFFGYGEETGWRGFALPRLQARYQPLSASLLLAVFWALWHWPLFFYRPGYVSMDMAGITGWLLSMATGSILLSWLFNGSGGSVLICAIFHATVDIAFTSNFAESDIVAWTGMLITVGGLIIALLPRRFSPDKRIIVVPSDEHS
jgi:membrane protease YdiL (CAAX protease family)